MYTMYQRPRAGGVAKTWNYFKENEAQTVVRNAV